MTREKDKICLIVFREEMGIEEVIEELYLQKKAVLQKLDIKSDEKIDNILVVYRDLAGALYNARTTEFNGSEIPGRVSTIYHPLYMQKKAFNDYLESSIKNNSIPLILADITTITRRNQAKGTETVGRTFQGVRDIVMEIAAEENLTFMEKKISDLIKT